MQVSINGTSKEVVAFLVSLSGRYAEVVAKPAPTVMEVTGVGAPSGQVKVELVKVEPTPEPKPETVKVETDAAKTEPVNPYPNGIPNPADEQKLDPPKTEEPKTRKRREKASGESKLGTGAPSAGVAPPKTEPVADAKPTAPERTVTDPADEFGLPAEWPVMSVQARRNWIQTAQHLAPSQRLELLHANPAPVAEPEPVKTTEPAKTDAAGSNASSATKAEPIPAADTATDCVLPPTWQAWSLPKRIMWATMRSVSETNSLLKQFGFADKIPDATADTLFNVRRKLEIAMRMEAQS